MFFCSVQLNNPSGVRLLKKKKKTHELCKLDESPHAAAVCSRAHQNLNLNTSMFIVPPKHFGSQGVLPLVPVCVCALRAPVCSTTLLCSGAVVTFSGHGLSPAFVSVPGVRLLVKDKPSMASAEGPVAEPLRAEPQRKHEGPTALPSVGSLVADLVEGERTRVRRPEGFPQVSHRQDQGLERDAHHERFFVRGVTVSNVPPSSNDGLMSFPIWTLIVRRVVT